MMNMSIIDKCHTGVLDQSISKITFVESSRSHWSNKSVDSGELITSNCWNKQLVQLVLVATKWKICCIKMENMFIMLFLIICFLCSFNFIVYLCGNVSLVHRRKSQESLLYNNDCIYSK